MVYVATLSEPLAFEPPRASHAPSPAPRCWGYWADCEGLTLQVLLAYVYEVKNQPTPTPKP